jgi:hypothetical protein
MTPKTKKKVTDKRLLKIWSEKGKIRSEFKCEYPDCNVNYHQVHAHHVFHRSIANTRYDIDNCIILCPVHHTLGQDSAHKDPTFIARIIACGVRTSEWFDKLIEKKNKIVKNNDSFKEQKLYQLENDDYSDLVF